MSLTATVQPSKNEGTTSIYLNLTHNLEALREAKGWTQGQVAIKLNISARRYADWERGERKPDAFSLLMLSDLFEVTVNDLFKSPTQGRMAA